MCGFVFVKYRYSKNNELENNFFEKECNNFIRNRGPSYQEIYKSNAMFIYQSTLAIQSDSIKSSNLSSIGSKKFILYTVRYITLIKKNIFQIQNLLMIYLKMKLFKMNYLEWMECMQ